MASTGSLLYKILTCTGYCTPGVGARARGVLPLGLLFCQALGVAQERYTPRGKTVLSPGVGELPLADGVQQTLQCQAKPTPTALTRAGVFLRPIPPLAPCSL